MDWDHYVDAMLRLGLAALCGLLIGIDRDAREKPAGMRTLALVSLGSALVTLSAVSFADFATHPDGMSRILQGAIQGVIAGIGFIGAGSILRTRGSGDQDIQGVTTAATVWLSAALGIACGLAKWPLVLVAMSLVFLIFFVAKPIERWIFAHFGLPDPESNSASDATARSSPQR